jgi:hypothetical protein
MFVVILVIAFLESCALGIRGIYIEYPKPGICVPACLHSCLLLPELENTFRDCKLTDTFYDRPACPHVCVDESYRATHQCV